MLKSTILDEYQYLYKILIIGDSGVGKTAISKRFTTDTYSENRISTIGVDFSTKNVLYDDVVYKLQLWDTAGQERFRALCTSYYKGAHACIIVYDPTDPVSFDNIKYWYKEIQENCGDETYVILVGSKSDLANERKITAGEARSFAINNKIDYIEVSSKNHTNIELLFDKIIDGIGRIRSSDVRVLSELRAQPGNIINVQVQDTPIENAGYINFPIIIRDLKQVSNKVSFWASDYVSCGK